jgi:hypothetical protein
MGGNITCQQIICFKVCCKGNKLGGEREKRRKQRERCSLVTGERVRESRSLARWLEGKETEEADAIG